MNTSETLSAAAGILLSLALAYVPGLAPAFERLQPLQKRLALLAALLAVAAGALGLACTPELAPILPGGLAECSTLGAARLAAAFIAALVANQAAYGVAVRRTRA
jgi:hypothetical protein